MAGQYHKAVSLTMLKAQNKSVPYDYNRLTNISYSPKPNGQVEVTRIPRTVN
jgi:hypothetical protein